MAEIVKIYKEHQPALRFIGKRYTDADRLNGSFGHKWGEWFQNNWFSPLEELGEADNIDNGYLGFMRCYPDYEYWIGMFLPPDTKAPEGYKFIDLDAADIGVCWIKGKDEDGSIYGMHNECLKQLGENGMDNYKTLTSEKAYFFERYNCPRFTEKDEDGNVILDYGVCLS